MFDARMRKTHMDRKASLRLRHTPFAGRALQSNACTRRRVGRRLAHALRSAITFGAIGVSLLAFCATVHAQQKPLTVEDAIALARPITHRDSSVHSVEVRGRGGSMQFAYVYEAPDRFEGLMAMDEPKFTYFATAGSRAVFYDPRLGELLEISGLFPGIHGAVQNNILEVMYSFAEERDGSPAPGLHIDLPLLFRDRNLMDGELQPLPGGKYRLAFASENESSLVATIDPAQSFAFTDIKVSTSTGKYVVELYINRVPPTSVPPIPSTPRLRQSIAVREIPLNMAALTRWVTSPLLLQAALAPRPLAIREGVQSPERRKAQSGLGEAVDWNIVDANLKRDVPKLQQVLSLP